MALLTETRMKQQVTDSAELRFRPFDYSDADYETAVAISNAIEPEYPSSVIGWRHWDKNHDPAHIHERYMVEQDGRVVAYGNFGHVSWSHRPGKFYIDVYVHPDSHGQGIGSALYDFLREQIDQHDPVKLISWTREHRANAVRFLEDRGFSREMRIPVSRLETQEFDPTPYAEKLQRVADSGIRITTMRELSQERPEDWKQIVYDLEWEALQDVPTTEPFTRLPFDLYEKRVWESPNLLQDAWFIAVDGDQYIGLSVLWKNLATPKLLGTGLTGVLRSHRRRGIATALKVHAIKFAQAYGAEGVLTDNEENNPMFQLNLQLGFKPQPAELLYELELDA